MNKKVAIVTGANGGMGKVLTGTLAKEGYMVIMACLNIDRATTVFEQFNATYPSQIALYPLNLASFASIIQFANQIKHDYEQIDILLNNAGILSHHADVTEEGFEITAGTNYLGHLLLTTLLTPLFKTGSRVVITGSMTHNWYNLSPSFLQAVTDKQFNRFKTYSDSKQALLFYTLDQAEIWREQGIAIHYVDPGIVNTGILCMDNRFIDSLCNVLFRPFIRTPEKGAETILYAALSPEIEGESGQFYANKRKKRLSQKEINHPMRKWLREEREKLLSTAPLTLNPLTL